MEGCLGARAGLSGVALPRLRPGLAERLMLDRLIAFSMDLGGLRLYRERVLARDGLLEPCPAEEDEEAGLPKYAVKGEAFCAGLAAAAAPKSLLLYG